ncbi:creatininase family protein [Alicyclobacillus sp. SO9]|uniref:creatininase family protein n=1 Tax=Alicyclobacillus sp. SO9 TaxID=2665646 RepID=UPI00351BF327
MAYVLSEMTWPQVKEAMETVKLALLPIGAHEQHGPHLHESCDAVLAERIARKIADELHPSVLVAPTIPFGMSMHHIHFPGTITLRAETLLQVLEDIIWSLKQHGLENFLIVNSHGGNQSLLSVASAQISQELQVNVTYTKTTASAKESIKKHVHSDLFGHSCEREVSESLYVAPEIVREDHLAKGEIQEGPWRWLRPGQAIQGFYYYDEMTKNGAIGNAPAGSYEAGREIVEEAVKNTAEAARKIFDLNPNFISRN